MDEFSLLDRLHALPPEVQLIIYEFAYTGFYIPLRNTMQWERKMLKVVPRPQLNAIRLKFYIHNTFTSGLHPADKILDTLNPRLARVHRVLINYSDWSSNYATHAQAYLIYKSLPDGRFHVISRSKPYPDRVADVARCNEDCLRMCAETAPDPATESEFSIFLKRVVRVLPAFCEPLEEEEDDDDRNGYRIL